MVTGNITIVSIGVFKESQGSQSGSDVSVSGGRSGKSQIISGLVGHSKYFGFYSEIKCEAIRRLGVMVIS